MANSNTSQGRPADFRNMSPFAGSAKSKKSGKGQGALMIGVIGILAFVALILCTLIMKAA